MGLDMDQVQQSLCALTARVGSVVYGNRKASDCWCGEKVERGMSFQFDEGVLKFIEDAVNEKIARLPVRVVYTVVEEYTDRSEAITKLHDLKDADIEAEVLTPAEWEAEKWRYER